METINFTFNWNNKLDCSCFTTLRLESKKYIVGAEFMITIGSGKPLGVAKVLEVKELYLDKINTFISHLDTGLSVEACKELIKKMYPKVDLTQKKLYFILLEYQNE